MGLLKSTGKAFTSIVNVRADHWIGYQGLKASSSQILGLAKSMTTPEQPEQQEEFEDAIQRLNLSAEDLEQRKIEFTRLFTIYLLIAISLFTYSIVLFINNNWGSGFMTFCLTFYPLAMAFKFHFWLFQVKNKKLGCSLKEWWGS